MPSSLHVLGAGPAFDTTLSNTSLLLEGPWRVLLDVGFAAAQPLWRRSMDADYLDAIFLSHFHADHTFGLPAVLLLMISEGRNGGQVRRKPLTLVGPPGLEQYVRELMRLAYPGQWERFEKAVPLTFISLSPGSTGQVGPFTVKVAKTEHGEQVTSLASRWEWDNKVLFCYSGDGKATTDSQALYAGTPVLVHECYAVKDAGDMHEDLPTVLQLAQQAGVRQLVLVHSAMDKREELRAALAQMVTGSLSVTLAEGGDITIDCDRAYAR
ncbi:MAG: MBL fold metallo-hydrolase [Roseimicrobium sp.]